MKKLVMILALIPTMGWAQTFTNYTETEGLVNDAVNSVSVDGDGNIWFGTQAGVSKFDGISSWETFQVAIYPGLVNDAILEIFADADGNIWAGTDYGISKFDGTSWVTFTTDDGLADNRIKCISQSSNGDLWIGNSDGLSIFDGVSTWTSYTTSAGLPFGGIQSVTFKSNGDALLGSGLGGLVLFSNGSFTTTTEADGLLNDKVRGIQVGLDGTVWVGTSDGVSTFDDNESHLTNHTRVFVLPAPDTLNPIVDVAMDSYGSIWTGVYVDYLVTEGGVSWQSGTTWIQYDESDGLAGPVVRDIEIDALDQVWVATSTGVSKISDMPRTSVKEGLSSAIKIYPNPVSNTLYVENATSSVELFSASRLIKSFPASEQVKIDCTDLASGIYFLKSGGHQKKIIVLNK